MKVSNSRKIIAILWMSLAWVSTTNTHAEDIAWKQVDFQNKVEPAQTGFPEKLKTMIELPGKKDFIEIPMQESFYINNFVQVLGSNGEYGSKMRSAFISVTPAQEGIVKAKFKTDGRRLTVSVQDMDTLYDYKYSFGNGYVFETKTSILIYDLNDKNIGNEIDKIEYIKNKIDKYFISQGYKNTTSAFSKFFNNSPKYQKDNIMIDTDLVGFTIRANYFRITATNKEIEDNIDSITKSSKNNDLAIEYKNLDVILDTK